MQLHIGLNTLTVEFICTLLSSTTGENSMTELELNEQLEPFVTSPHYPHPVLPHLLMISFSCSLSYITHMYIYLHMYIYYRLGLYIRENMKVFFFCDCVFLPEVYTLGPSNFFQIFRLQFSLEYIQRIFIIHSSVDGKLG